jgi:hypothetical protein
MKKIVVTLLLFISFIGYSQTNGITYQAVILNPPGDQLPGVNNINAPLANKNICLKFSIIDHNSQTEYIETIQTTTDEFGMVNLIIGTGDQIGGYASSFANIIWNTNPKRLKVDLSMTGVCSYYTEISNQPFTAVPFALFAANSESTAALAALQATVASNATATTAALVLKEDNANKSTTTTLGTSNVLFPTQNAVKTYVDTNITTVNANNTALQATVAANAADTTTALGLKEDAGNKSNAALGTSITLFPTQNAVKTYVDSQVASATIPDANATTKGKIKLAGDLGGTADVPTVPGLALKANTSDVTTSLAIKEDTANKSTTTTLGTSDVLFPTQKAVKTYVDTNISTSNTANTATIAAVQADVDANETAANTAIAAVQADVDANETATTAALVLKEDTANKSTTTTLGTSDVLFPTQKAVKTYVDTNVSTSNSANTAAIAAVQADVDANETAANTAIAAVQADVDANETATTAALVLKEDTANKSTTTTLGTSDVLFPTQKAVKTYVDTNVSNSNSANTAAIAAVQADVDANETATQTALDLKENLANKSTDIIADAASTTKYPAVKTIKDYVDSSVTSGAPDATDLVKGKVQLAGDLGGTAALPTVPGLTLKEDTANKSTTTTLGTSDVLFPTQKAVKTYVDTNISSSNTANTAAIAAVQADVDANETAANTAIAAVQADVDANETATTAALVLKEDTANKSTTTTLGTSDVLFPTQKAVKTYVDNQIASATIVDADATTKGKVQLAGDLAGTNSSASAPIISADAITTVKIINSAVTSDKIADGAIVNADINTSAAIADTKLATIATSGKVSNSATTATDANTASTIVARDASGNFSAGTITANLTGNATNVTGTVAVANGGTGVATAAANTVFAGPTSGASPAAPSFRGLVAADLPSGSTNYINNTTTQQSASFNISGSGTVGTDLTLSALTASRPVFTDANKKLTSAGTLGVSQGGTGLTTTPTNGQILIGNGTGFTLANLTQGTGITISNSNGSIAIAASAAAVRPTTDQFSATANQTTFTLTQTPLTNANSRDNVWMFINGVRTNNDAYSVSGTTVTYVPGSNGSYALLANDRIQFDYMY